MRKIIFIGECPKCGTDELNLYKTKAYKRFVKCESETCKFSYAVPKAGKIENTTLLCPNTKVPILLVLKKDKTSYFWTDRPCFTCIDYTQCSEVNCLINEFKELKVNGY